MPMSNADNPMAEPAKEPAADPMPAKKAKSAKSEPAVLERAGLADAAASSDPYVQKLMFDRGFGGDDTTAIDDELRKLGFDL